MRCFKKQQKLLPQAQDTLRHQASSTRYAASSSLKHKIRSVIKPQAQYTLRHQASSTIYAASSSLKHKIRCVIKTRSCCPRKLQRAAMMTLLPQLSLLHYVIPRHYAALRAAIVTLFSPLFRFMAAIMTF